MIAVSIVSHLHGKMVEQLVRQVCDFPEVSRVILTLNVHEDLNLPESSKINLISNAKTKGFSKNHNAAFRFCREPYFCVLNPDVILIENPFPSLMSSLKQEGASLVAPGVLSLSGHVEDSFRQFPSIVSIFLKLCLGKTGAYSVHANSSSMCVDWVAGMFMFFDAARFSMIGGFHEGYFLYYEDVDICMRLKHAGQKVLACPAVQIVHDARRASHKNARHFLWHLTSMARYFLRCLKYRS